VTEGHSLAEALHPFFISVPYRHKYFAQALEHICRHKEVWLATGSEIASWYSDHYLNS